MPVAIIDACALINLLKSGGARKVLASVSAEVWFQGLVEDEVIGGAAELQRLVEDGLLHRFDGNDVMARDVAQIATAGDIGLGEAECIAICLESDAAFISDDRRAREFAKGELGEKNVTGMIGLLCHCIDNGDLTCEAAAALLAQAQQAGGYLPQFDFETREMVA